VPVPVPPSTVAPVPATGGYREVTADQLVTVGGDGATQEIVDPLTDGIYDARQYAVTADGASVRFDLDRFLSEGACEATQPTLPEGGPATCAGGVEDTSATAAVTMPLDADVPVVLVVGGVDFHFYEVTAAELGRLLAGNPPSADAPAAFEFQPYWAAMLEIADGEIVRVSQRPSS